MKPRIGILIVAYNAVTTLAKVLDRIPADVYAEAEEIVVFDDASHDDTYTLAQGYKALKNFSKLCIYKNPQNLGYGGNQKKGYQYFIDKGFDIVVLLHGDGQYAPELLKTIYQPIVDNRADVVFGSRMMKDYGGPLTGGMPLYKYVGNRILSALENWLLEMNLTEFHSGYRAYSCHALQNILFQSCADDFHFDTEMIVKLNHQGYRIVEIPIPTYYGGEICYVNGVKYAFNVVRTVINYRICISGIKNIKTYSEFFKSYPLRQHRYSSHDQISDLVGSNKTVLDLGGSSGCLAKQLNEHNNFICGVDIEKGTSEEHNFDEFIQVDLDTDDRFGKIDLARFDMILCADIIEHLKNPDSLLLDIRKGMKSDAKVILSVPNVANIVIRLSLLFGKFSYSDSGILDRGHLRFFTYSTIKRLITTCGFKIAYVRSTPLPLFLFLSKSSGKGYLNFLETLFFKTTVLFKNLLSYQFIFVIVPGKRNPPAISG